MKVISCGGQASNGKDTVADYLVEQLRKVDPTWQRIGFAHAVKQVFMDTFQVDWDFIEEWKRKDEVPKGFNLPIRKSLQFIGDGFRQIQSDIWINMAFRKDENKIISDVRYYNEAKAVHEHGGLNILIWRPDWENDDPNPSESQIKSTVDWFVNEGLEGDMRGNKLSEIDGDIQPHLFDVFLRNEGTRDALFEKVDRLVVPTVLEHFYNLRTGHTES